MTNCINKIQLSLDHSKYSQGKVRDIYDLGDKLLLISTDRQSAFDRHLALVPYKGQTLAQTSLYWFETSRHIIDNHLIACIDPNCLVVKKCQVFPIEFIVRAYITGSTSTSLWTNYAKGQRQFCKYQLHDHFKKNQKLDFNIITPTSKSLDHDEAICGDEIVKQSLMSQAEFDFASQKALDLFAFGQEQALEKGLILADTKYEFGKDSEGNIILIDEIHTADSSRYWISESYKQRFDNGLEPDMIDKEFFRLWFSKRCDPYKDKNLPKPPQELIQQLSNRYIQLYETITKQKFIKPQDDEVIANRIQKNIEAFLANH